MFRPCIDIHNGKVKQIVGGSLDGQSASENYVAKHDADYFAALYKAYNLRGGHVIILNRRNTPEYEADKRQAFAAFQTFEGGLQAGGGIDPLTASDFLDAGASHVIATSYIFKDGILSQRHLDELVSAVGKEKLVLDLSCRREGKTLKIVCDRWQTFTSLEFSEETLSQLSGYCDQFLIHAVDAEGKRLGLDDEVLDICAQFTKKSGFPLTYAGGIATYADIEKINAKTADGGAVDFTVGSALDIFGGDLLFEKIAKM
ncbi:MAG: phosphoribosylformimino-5-aminoimidazole carboxamide ribotide isomerase [Ruminococcus sp.]|jgi:phosphoribosylformimino-5-aminoimidazole carboxamide ribotide isomerase|nr:phosphoribosylformimino-5-aminoimidazole carboxamide ribotide isomerase [Ruminococcus sp.]